MKKTTLVFLFLFSTSVFSNPNTKIQPDSRGTFITLVEKQIKDNLGDYKGKIIISHGVLSIYVLDKRYPDPQAVVSFLVDQKKYNDGEVYTTGSKNGNPIHISAKMKNDKFQLKALYFVN